MKSEKLLHAIGTIDDGLIFAARPAEKKKTPRTRIVLDCGRGGRFGAHPGHRCRRGRRF